MIELARMRNIVLFVYGQFPSLFLLHKSKKINIKEKIYLFEYAILMFHVTMLAIIFFNLN